MTALLQAPCWHCFASPCAQAEVGQAWGLQHSLLSLSLSLSGAGGLPQVCPARGGLGRSSQTGELRAERGGVSGVAAGAALLPLQGQPLSFGGEGVLPPKQLWEWFP